MVIRPRDCVALAVLLGLPACVLHLLCCDGVPLALACTLHVVMLVIGRSKLLQSVGLLLLQLLEGVSAFFAV